MIGFRNFALVLLAAAIVIAVSMAMPWMRFILTVVLAKTLAVFGVHLLLRGGQVSFGHALYVAISAYAVAFLAPVVPELILLVPAAILISVAASVVLGLFVSRYRDIFFGMLNLAMSMVFYSLLEKFYAITRGTDGLRVAPTRVLGYALSAETASWIALGLGLLLVTLFGCLLSLYLASPMGQALAGIKTRETRLEFMGVPARRVLLAAYVLAGAMAASGGVVLALAAQQVTPALAYWTASGELVFIAVLGGTGSVAGPILGALGFELTRVYAAAHVAGAWQMILGFMLLGVILFVPGGLVDILRRVTRTGPARQRKSPGGARP